MGREQQIICIKDKRIQKNLELDTVQEGLVVARINVEQVGR